MSCGVGTILWTILGRGRVAVASSAPLLPCPRAALLKRAITLFAVSCLTRRRCVPGCPPPPDGDAWAVGSSGPTSDFDLSILIDCTLSRDLARFGSKLSMP
jgi:hypothetical protein